MKIVFVANIPSPYRTTIYDQLAKMIGDNFSVIYCAKTHADRDWELPELNHHHSFLKKRAIHYGEKTIHFNWGINKILRGLNPDVVITAGFNPTMLLAQYYCLSRRKKLLIMTDAWSLAEKGYSFLHILLRKFIYKRAAAFLPASKKSFENFLSYGITPEKLFISPHAIDVAHYNRFIGQQKKYDIMFSGQFIERKLPFFFCQVAIMLKRSYPGLKILIIGNGPLKEKMMRILKDTQVDFSFPGFIQKEDLPAYYASAKLLLFPTLIDQWGVVANDACAVGTPVITCDNAGAAGDLVIDGFNGCVLPLDQQLWTEKIILLLHNKELYEQFSQNSILQMKKYTPEKAAEAIIKAATFALSTAKS